MPSKTRRSRWSEALVSGRGPEQPGFECRLLSDKSLPFKPVDPSSFHYPYDAPDCSSQHRNPRSSSATTPVQCRSRCRRRTSNKPSGSSSSGPRSIPEPSHSSRRTARPSMRPERSSTRWPPGKKCRTGKRRRGTRLPGSRTSEPFFPSVETAGCKRRERSSTPCRLICSWPLFEKSFLMKAPPVAFSEPSRIPSGPLYVDPVILISRHCRRDQFTFSLLESWPLFSSTLPLPTCSSAL